MTLDPRETLRSCSLLPLRNLFFLSAITLTHRLAMAVFKWAMKNPISALSIFSLSALLVLSQIQVSHERQHHTELLKQVESERGRNTMLERKNKRITELLQLDSPMGVAMKVHNLTRPTTHEMGRHARLSARADPLRAGAPSQSCPSHPHASAAAVTGGRFQVGLPAAAAADQMSDRDAEAPGVYVCMCVLM